MRRAHVVGTARIAFQEAWRIQRDLAQTRRAGRIDDVIWLLEHDPVYTTGRHGDRTDLWLDDRALAARGASFVRLDRGGQMTWHGPGQTTAYVIARLRDLGQGRRGSQTGLRPGVSVRGFVSALVESAAVAARTAGIDRARADLDAMGVYVDGRKLASVGIRVAGGVSLHGLALNREPDLGWFSPMAACGAPGVPATSIANEGGDPARAATEAALLDALAARLGLAPEPTSLGVILDGGRSPLEQRLPRDDDLGESERIVGVGTDVAEPRA